MSDDTALIRRIAEAQLAAFEEFYERHSRLVFSIALRILGDRATAEEVTLDIFVRVWQKAGTYRAEQAKVSTWLIALTRHHAIDILRNRRSHPEPDALNEYEISLVEPRSARGLDEQVETSLQGKRIREALAQLPAEQCEALMLAYFKGYTHSEIAEALHQPLGTVKTRIRMGMQKLRQMLADE